MIEVNINNILLNETDLNMAFSRTFGNEILAKIHGHNIKISPWKDNKRHVKFKTNIDNIPIEIRRFFCGKDLNITNN